MSQPRSHFHGGFFRNRYSSAAHGPSLELLKFFWKMRSVSAQGMDLPVLRPDVAWLKANRTETSLTWVGHSTFLFQHAGINLVTDPHLTHRASPFSFAGPARFNKPALDFSELPGLDVALISHNHYDHLDDGTVRRLAKEHPKLVFAVPRGLKAWFARRGISQVVELDLWESADIGPVKVHCVPVQHFSGRGATDRNKTLWCGLIAEFTGAGGGKKLFFAGDTGYSQDFKDIGERFAPIDLSLLPIGAYDPRWFMAPVHVNPEEAVHIHQDVGSKLSVAMHWGTFRLTLEDLDEPPRKLAEALATQGIAPEKFRVMQHGETLKPSL